MKTEQIAERCRRADRIRDGHHAENFEEQEQTDALWEIALQLAKIVEQMPEPTR